jgi:hypothetical protein
MNDIIAKILKLIIAINTYSKGLKIEEEEYELVI